MRAVLAAEGTELMVASLQHLEKQKKTENGVFHFPHENRSLFTTPGNRKNGKKIPVFHFFPPGPPYYLENTIFQVTSPGTPLEKKKKKNNKNNMKLSVVIFCKHFLS